ncbi:hypothetical protein DICSQDRAFT_12056, partial [Dichomitus squalens LYAD-421 SS1]|uniref:uncharacterized protein n=1 Tax=Dichomitus squalens (strain LYAD-421) TaxID=732165 RepID=UPI00044147F1
DIDTIMDPDMRDLVQLAEGIEDEERETRRVRAIEEKAQQGSGQGSDKWVDEIATLTDEQREEFEAKVRPVKVALVKIRKISFKIVNSSTKLLPAWRAVVAEHKLPDRLLPRNVRTRWNSTYDMLSEALVFRKPIDKLTDEE